jgi:DNA-binding transcriptional regulator YbjK
VGRRQRGPNDPERKQRIIEAAVNVVAERGVAGLTARAVAQAADVPLGSVTYYFEGRNELLGAAMSDAMERFRLVVDAWAADLPLADIPSHLANLLTSLSAEGPDRNRLIVEYELYLAGLRYPSLRSISETWDNMIVAALAQRLGSDQADAVGALANGFLMSSIVRRRPLVKGAVEQSLRRLLGEK